jgi:hypothetical protein
MPPASFVSHPPRPLDALPTPAAARHDSDPAILERVRAEFVEMRGFSPTLLQAARLFQLSPDHCRSVLDRLISEGFLECTAAGQYRLLLQE